MKFPLLLDVLNDKDEKISQRVLVVDVEDYEMLDIVVVMLGLGNVEGSKEIFSKLVESEDGRRSFNKIESFLMEEANAGLSFSVVQIISHTVHILNVTP